MQNVKQIRCCMTFISPLQAKSHRMCMCHPLVSTEKTLTGFNFCTETKTLQKKREADIMANELEIDIKQPPTVQW